MTRRAIHRLEYEHFRKLLLEARDACGLTQVQLAEKLQKPQSFVSKCERGERRVDFTEFLEIADALGLDLDQFVRDYRSRLKQMPITPKARKKPSA